MASRKRSKKQTSEHEEKVEQLLEHPTMRGVGTVPQEAKVEAVEQVLAKEQPAPLVVEQFQVYRDRGFMALTFETDGNVVEYTYANDLRIQHMREAFFHDVFVRTPQFDAVELALNLLVRMVCRSESNPPSIRLLRRLRTMITKESLEKLSDRALAREYNATMGTELKKISGEGRAKKIEELMAKLEEKCAAVDKGGEATDAEVSTSTTSSDSSTESPGGNPAPGSETAAPTQETDMASKKKATKKATKKTASKKSAARSTEGAATKKTAAPKTYPASNKKNPYREGSMKEKAYNIFAKGGERGDICAAIIKLGATEKTASSWVQFFRRYVATGVK